MNKDIILPGVRVPFELSTSISTYLALNPGQTYSDLIRNILEDFFSKQDHKFISDKVNKYKRIIEELEESKNILQLKEKNIKKIPSKEIEFLLESKETIEKNPNYLLGKIDSYTNIFKKSYKISIQDFFKLIMEAEKQCKKKG